MTYDLTKIKLSVKVFNVSLKQIQYISYETNPDLTISLLAMMTTAIPFLFKPVQYKDENGIKTQKNFSGIEAICLQHEIDHLNGKLFVDHISKLKKNRIIKKLEKIKNTKA